MFNFLKKDKRKTMQPKIDEIVKKNSEFKNKIYNSDSALNDKIDDRFGRYNFAQRIVNSIEARQDNSSIVIGINGIWGEGKTTVLNFIEEELSLNDDIITFKFNPWRFKNENLLLMSFFKLLSEKLGKKLKNRKEKIGELMDKYAELLIPFQVTIAGVINVSPPTQGIKNAGKALSEIDIEEIKYRIEKILEDENKRIVIIMDDIDRLDKEEIQAIFKLVKIAGDFKNIIYILAFDEEMVASALEEKYSNSGSSRKDSGRNFLEKIIQVPLHLPKADDSLLRTFSLECIDEAIKESNVILTKDEIDDFVRNYISGIEVMVKTPRIARRYSNILQFSLPLLNGEVNIVDFMLVEGIRVFYPKLYKAIKESSDIFLNGNNNNLNSNSSDKKEIFETFIANLTQEESEASKRLIKYLFPKTESLYRNISYNYDWDKTWSEKQRICSKEYYTRYFSYSIGMNDLSDLKIEEIVTKLNLKIDLTKELNDLINEKNAEKFLIKLNSKSSNFEKKGIEEIVVYLFKYATKFPNNEVLFGLSTFKRCALIVSDLIEKLNDYNEEVKLLEKGIENSTPVIFSFEVLKWYKSKFKDKNIVFNDEDKLIKCIIKRIKEKLEMENTPDYIEKRDAYLEYILLSKYGFKSFIEDYLIKSFEETKNISIFLYNYIPTSYGLENGKSFKGNFEKDQYNGIKEIINPDLLFDILLKIYGDELNNPEYEKYKMENKSYDEARIIANQFSYIHLKVKEETQTTDNI